jgi:hypothetical protein
VIADANPFPRFHLFPGLCHRVAVAGSVLLLLAALWLMWEDGEREPIVRAGSTSTPVMLNGDGRP